MELLPEFERQVEVLITKGYATAAGYTEAEFKKMLLPLAKYLEGITLPDVDLELGKLPFVIVVRNEVISNEAAMALVEKDGKSGITKLFPHQPSDFSTIEQVEVPTSSAYLLLDIDRGKSTINLPPNQAFPLIRAEQRSALTIEEGIAIVTQFPDFLIKNNCFSLLASRHTGDQRVPAIWINGQKHPNLGWCWDGNPHTWLGSASAKKRVGS